MRSILLGLIATLYSIPAFADDPAYPGIVIKPLMAWTGTDSKISEKSYFRYLSNDEWSKAWKKHKDLPERNSFARDKCPEFDFDSHMLIGGFHGKGGMNHGTEAKIFDMKDQILVRYRPRFYQVADTGPDSLKFEDYATQSFFFLLVPKSNKPIVFEEDMSRVIGGLPEWTQQAKMPAVEPRAKPAK